jgi:hypothetical protein
MALGIGYGLPFIAQHGANPYKTQWAAAREGAKGAGATVEDENAGAGSCLVSRGQEAYTDGLPSTPSLLIVPQFYKDGNLYQDVPPFVAEDSTMRFTVSRNTTATRVNSSGLIESVASGVPRIDWLGQSCPALLVEASGQNLALRSEDFTTTWNAVNTTPTANQATAPDNTLTADRISITSNNGYIRQLLATSNSTTYTASCFVKNDTVASGDTFRFYFNNNTSAPNAAVANAIININAGTVSTGSSGGGVSAVSTGIENYGNGWYRVRVTFTLGASAGSANSEIGFDAPTATRTFFAWGAQAEAGSVATTYIPTTTAAATRAADTIIASGALVSSLIGQTEGVLYCEFTLSSISDVIVVPNAYNSAQNYVGILHNGTNSLVLRIRYRSGGSNLNINFTQVATIGTTYKVAIGYKSGDSAAFVNGVQVGSTDTTAFAFENPLTLIEILVRQFYSSALFGPNRIRAAALYTTRLSNDQLAELTRLT